jgi:flavin reductase
MLLAYLNARELSSLEPEATSIDGPTYPEVDIKAYKSAFGSFATGVTIATTASAGQLHGVTANAVMSVSLEPLLVLVSIQNGTRMLAALRQSDNFALSMLATSQLEIAEYFADSTRPHGTEAFVRFPYHRGYTGAPLMDGALACVESRLVDVHAAGDHTLFIGRVVQVETLSFASPLLYFRGKLS